MASINRSLPIPTLALLSMAVLVIPLMLFSSRASSEPPRSNLKSDEEIVFYPTYGHFDAAGGQWRCSIHGKVFEPEDNSIKRSFFLSWLRSSLKERVDGDELRDDRVRHFLVDNEGGKSVIIDIVGERQAVGTSGSNGHFSAELSIASERSPVAGAPHVVDYRAVLPERDARSFTGRVHLIAPTGVSVISDVDDTIKDSHVTDKSELLRNTFMRDFHAVEGMSELYRRLSDSGASFHYVSGSPWQLFRPLESFLSQSGFPMGTLHLKHFRLKDSSAFDLIGSQLETKISAITPLLAAFPNRRFLLIGDTGEQDPEIYGQLARQYPDQIAGIYLRNVTAAQRDDARFGIAFQDVPDALWNLFDQPPAIDLSSLPHPDTLSPSP